jgi:hypothetical protein
VEFLSAALKRRKEVRKLSSSAAGSASKRKRSMGTPTHERFKPGVAYLSWPAGSVCDVSPNHPRVKWEVVQIYEHLVNVFGGDEAAAKMNQLTAPTTKTSAIGKMKQVWDSGFPAYSSAPRTAIRAALIAFKTEKPPLTA